MSYSRTDHHATAQVQNHLMLSAKPEKAAGEMISIIKALHEIYEEETEALKASQIQTFLDLQASKVRATEDYKLGMVQMMERQTEMRGINPTLKTTLRAMQHDFSKLAEENLSVLGRMQRTTERLGETIRSAAKNFIETRTATSYSHSGALNTYKKGNVSVGITETV